MRAPTRRGRPRSPTRAARPEVYAKAAGVTLGRLIEIRDGSAQPYQPQPEMRMRMAMAKGADEVPIVPPATIRYNAGVQMVWEMAAQP